MIRKYLQHVFPQILVWITSMVIPFEETYRSAGEGPLEGKKKKKIATEIREMIYRERIEINPLPTVEKKGDMIKAFKILN